MEIRPIISSDNKTLAAIIRACLIEFKAGKPGTVFFDKTTDTLSDLFKMNGSKYFVVLQDGEIVGGAGIFPTHNLPAETCELVKLYLDPKARGKGLGKILMKQCEEEAKKLGYKKVYLETMPELAIAVPLYEKMGYKYLPSPLGNTGHGGCDIWMLKKL
ncbi:MAG: GNAT family N-acetyltransferase [Ferruginibacter sp.]